MNRMFVSMLTAAAGGLALTSCGTSSVELEVGQAYCFAIGPNPESANRESCENIYQIYIARSDGALDTLSTADSDVEFHQQIKITGNEMEMDDELRPIRMSDGHILIRYDDEDDDDEYRLWLVPTDNGKARSIKKLDQALADLDATTPLPGDQPAYVDVPLCDIEIQFKNNEVGYQTNPCSYDITFFAANGRVVKIQTDSLVEEGEIEWGYSGEWSKSNGVGRPDRQSSFTWGASEDGSPISERRRDNPQRASFGQQRAYDRNVLETQLAYPFFEGARRDEVMQIYKTEIYPIMRRRDLLEKHIPNWSQR